MEYCRFYFYIGWGHTLSAVEGCGKILLTRLVSYNCGDRCLRALVRADSTVRQCLSPSRVLSLGRHSFSERTFLFYNRPRPLSYFGTAVFSYHVIRFIRKYELLRVKFITYSSFDRSKRDLIVNFPESWVNKIAIMVRYTGTVKRAPILVPWARFECFQNFIYISICYQKLGFRAVWTQSILGKYFLLILN